MYTLGLTVNHDVEVFGKWAKSDWWGKGKTGSGWNEINFLWFFSMRPESEPCIVYRKMNAVLCLFFYGSMKLACRY